MKMADIRKLTIAELNKNLIETKKELFNLKFQSATGNLEKPHRIKELRHTVARIKTELTARAKNNTEPVIEKTVKEKKTSKIKKEDKKDSSSAEESVK